MEYEALLRHAKRAYPRYRTKEAAARLAAGDAVVMERHLSRVEKKDLADRIAKDILNKEK